MISSGIKRGLAASAVSAMAVAGLPLLASSADAATGDSFTVTYTGPALNGGDEGALVIIRAKNGQIDPTLLKATGTSSPNAGSEDTADQNVQVLSATSDGAGSGGTGFELIEVRVAVTTSTVGDTASFRLFEDDSTTNNTLDAAEARQPVSISTAGAIASVDVTPATQSTPQNIESGDYTVTIKDAAGRTTQLLSGDQLNITKDASVTITETGPDTVTANDDTITSDEIIRGTDTFTGNGTTTGTYDITVTDATTPTATDKAQLVVTQAATLTAADIDIVTAADTWDGPGDGTDGGTTYTRVDQNTIRVDFDAPNSQKNSNVLLTVNSADVTFGGKNTASYTTTLDANGNGSITINVDPGSIQAGDSFDFDANGFDQTIVFQRAVVTTIDGESAVYFCQDDASCTVTAVVRDQFGNPVTTGEVSARRTGPQNVDTTPQRKAVGPDGTVDFTFTDTNPADGGTDTVEFAYFTDSFDNSGAPTDASTTIKYSATGQGSDYKISLDGNDTEASTYKPSDAAVIPLFDTVDDTTTGPTDEDADIAITNGEPNQDVTLSVDNGALILKPGDTDLSDGVSSVDTTLDGAGNLPADYRVIGTKSGLVTLTVTSAGRTETAQLTVKAQDNVDSARNVTLTAPASVPFGTNQVTFTGVVTDAFGNPVPGVPNGVFNKQVSGPGMYQDGDSETDANGQIKFNVRVDSGATGDITLTVDATDGYGQFGADEDRQTAASLTDDGQDLPVSSDVASATTTVEPEVVPPAGPVTPNLTLKGHSDGKKVDVLFANANNQAAGGTITLFRKVNGAFKQIASSAANSRGNHRFRVADLNGNKKTTYKAVIDATDSTTRGVGKKRLQ